MNCLGRKSLVALSIVLAVFVYLCLYNVAGVSAVVPPYVNGVLGQYYDAAEPNNISYKRLIRIDDNVAFNWQTGSPDATIEPDTFSVVWTGYIEVPTTGSYDFYTYSDDGVQLSIGWGGAPIINRWGLVNLEFTKSNQSLYMEQGVKYPFALKYQEIPINATVFLFWQRDGGPLYIVPPSAFYVCVGHYSKYNHPVHVNRLQANGNGLKGEYFAGAQTVVGGNSAPDYTVNGENINYEWGLSAPAPGIPKDDFSVRWTGYLEAKYTEDVTLQVISDDGVRMWIDDVLVLDKWEAYSNVLHVVPPIAMVNGNLYKITIEYNDIDGGATCILFWKSQGQESEIIPQKYLYSTHPGENPSGPDPDPGPCDIPGDNPDPEPEPNSDFIDYLMSEKLYVYGNNAVVNGSSRINGADAVVVVKNNFNPGSGDVSYITTKNIYIQGNVILSGSAGLGSYDGSSTIYVNGDVTVNGGTSTAGHEGRIFGRLYYTGNLNVSYGITLAAQTQKVNSITFPQFDIPSLRTDDWYSFRGYTADATLRDNMKYFGPSISFADWGNKYFNNCVIASKGNITLSGDVHGTGILFAPNGKVSIEGSSTFTGIIIAQEIKVEGNASVTFQPVNDASKLPF